MIAFLTLLYVGLLALLVKLRILPNSAGTWLSTIGWVLVLFLVLFIPMQWGAPSGPVTILARSVQIIPNVSGEVTEISVRANEPMKRGDPLFEIDDRPFAAAVAEGEARVERIAGEVEQDRERLEAALASREQALTSLGLAQKRYDEDAILVERGAIPANRLDNREDNLQAAQSALETAEAQVAAAEAEIGAVVADGRPAKLAEAEAALDRVRWELEQTRVEAPGDGFVTYLGLMPGQRVTNLPLQPSMIFVDTSEIFFLAQIQQIHLRFVEPGQTVEVAFKSRPGRVYEGEVEKVLDVSSQGQVTISGNLPVADAVLAEPFFVRFRLHEPDEGLDPGMVGTAAIYTDSVEATHIIRKVMLRMESILNYVVASL